MLITFAGWVLVPSCFVLALFGVLGPRAETWYALALFVGLPLLAFILCHVVPALRRNQGQGVSQVNGQTVVDV